MKHKISLLLIIIGGIIMVSPIFINNQAELKQKRLLNNEKKIQNKRKCTKPRAAETNFGDAYLDFNKSYGDLSHYEVAETQEIKAQVTETKEPKADESQADVKRETIGVLIIDELDLELPVLRDYTEKNLNISAVVVSQIKSPLESGNLTIAAHRTNTYGKHFNRLHELEKDSIIKLLCDRQTYSYKVYSTFTVEPEETWITGSREDVYEITLFTCTTDSKQRHVVKALLINDD